MALSAVNMAENAGSLISTEVMSEIYVTAAIQAYILSFPDGFHLIAVRILFNISISILCAFTEKHQ